MKQRLFPILLCSIGALWLGVPVSLFSQNGSQDGAPSSIRASDLIPSDEAVSEWKTVEGPTFYNPGSLFEYVNGAAPFYLNLGFHQLAHVRFQNSRDETLNVTIDIYDQGTVEGGFGVYSSSRHPNEKFEKWGTQGYRSGPLAILWKERFYVSLQGDDERPPTIAALNAYAEWISQKIPGPDIYPKLLDKLPQKNRIENTELYTGKDYLGYRILDKTASAQYRVQEATVTLFVLDASGPEKLHPLYEEITRLLGTPVSLSPDRVPPDTTFYATTNKYLGNFLILPIHQYLYGLFNPNESVDFPTLFLMADPLLKTIEQSP